MHKGSSEVMAKFKYNTSVLLLWEVELRKFEWGRINELDPLKGESN